MKNVSKMFFFLSPSLTFTFLGAHYLLPNIFCVMYRVLYRVGDDRSLSAMYAVALGFTIMVYTTKVFQTWKLIIIQVMTVIPATTVLLSLRKNMHLRNKLKLVLLQLSYEKNSISYPTHATGSQNWLFKSLSLLSNFTISMNPRIQMYNVLTRWGHLHVRALPPWLEQI